MDHGGPIPMGSDFGGMPSEPGQFLPQQGPGPDMMPGAGNGGSGGGRGGSPEFMSPGNFSDNPQQLNEGLVWQLAKALAKRAREQLGLYIEQ